MSTSPPLLDLLYEAMTKKHGLVVSCNDPIALRKRLNELRRKTAIPVHLVLSPTNPGSDLWIIKRSDGNAQE